MKWLSLSTLLFSLLILSACAHYRPQPLPDSLPGDAPDPAIIDKALSSVRLKPQVTQHYDLSRPLEPAAIAALAVINNPDVKVLRARAGVSDAQVFAAGLLPDPVFSAGIDHILSGPDPVDNLSASLGIDLKAISRRSLSRREASQNAKQVRMDLAWAEWQTASDARITASRVAWLSRVVANAEKARDLQSNLVAKLTAATERGDVASHRLVTAQTALANTEATADQVGQALDAARQKLNRLTGLPPDTTLHLAAQAENLPPGFSNAALFEMAVRSRADLAALRAGYAAQEATVHQAVLDQFPSLDLTINASRDTGTNKLLGPSLSFTLPVWNRNRGGIAVARASRSELQAAYRARLFHTRADIAATIANLARLGQQIGDIDQRLPDLRRITKASVAAAERGDIAQVDADQAQTNLLDMEMTLDQLQLQRNEQAIALELLTGVPRQQWKTP